MTDPFDFGTGAITVGAQVDGLVDQESLGSESNLSESDMRSVQDSCEKAPMWRPALLTLLDFP